MCSKVCSGSAVRRSAAQVSRLVHTGRNSTPNDVARHASTPRSRARAGGNLIALVPRKQGLRGMVVSPAQGLVLVGRTFSSLPQPSGAVTTTTKLSVEGGVMTISLPLPGLPGLTAVSVPTDVPVRDFVKELMALDKR